MYKRPFPIIMRQFYNDVAFLLDAAEIEVMTWLKPSLTVNIHAAIDVSGGSGTVSTAFTQPDYARNVVMTTADNANDDLAGTITLTGTDMHGAVITEDFDVEAGTDVYTGVKAFATITSIAYDFGVTAAANDTLTPTAGVKLGLPSVATAAVKETFDGSNRALGTLDTTNNTYETGGTMNGSKAIELVYKVKIA